MVKVLLQVQKLDFCETALALLFLSKVTSVICIMVKGLVGGGIKKAYDKMYK